MNEAGFDVEVCGSIFWLSFNSLNFNHSSLLVAYFVCDIHSIMSYTLIGCHH